MTLAPSTRLRLDEFTLGQHVRYTHVAVVVRWLPIDREDPAKGREWVVMEPKKWRDYPPKMTPDYDGALFKFDDPYPSFGDPFYRRALVHHVRGEHAPELLTKTVLVAPVESDTGFGEGVVIGLLRRGVGTGYRSHYSPGGMWGEADYDPGFFVAQAMVPLLVVRHYLTERDYALVPTFAASAA